LAKGRRYRPTDQVRNGKSKPAELRSYTTTIVVGLRKERGRKKQLIEK